MKSNTVRSPKGNRPLPRKEAWERHGLMLQNRPYPDRPDMTGPRHCQNRTSRGFQRSGSGSISDPSEVGAQPARPRSWYGPTGKRRNWRSASLTRAMLTSQLGRSAGRFYSTVCLDSNSCHTINVEHLRMEWFRVLLMRPADVTRRPHLFLPPRLARP